jgi:hypothetical protein
MSEVPLGTAEAFPITAEAFADAVERPRIVSAFGLIEVLQQKRYITMLHILGTLWRLVPREFWEYISFRARYIRRELCLITGLSVHCTAALMAGLIVLLCSVVSNLLGNWFWCTGGLVGCGDTRTRSLSIPCCSQLCLFFFRRNFALEGLLA